MAGPARQLLLQLEQDVLRSAPDPVAQRLCVRGRGPAFAQCWLET